MGFIPASGFPAIKRKQVGGNKTGAHAIDIGEGYCDSGESRVLISAAPGLRISSEILLLHSREFVIFQALG
jgi:hypothetical protein